MKKILVVGGLLIGLFALAVSPAAAQITGKGAKLGLAIANCRGDLIEDLNDFFDVDNAARFGFALGGYVTINIIEGFSLQPELLLIQKGTKWSGEESGEFLGTDWKVAFKDVMRLTYLEMPILAKYSFVINKSMMISFFTGPSFAFKLGAKEYKWEYIEVGGEHEEDEEIEDIDEIKVADVGLVVGTGIETYSTFSLVFISLFDVVY